MLLAAILLELMGEKSQTERVVRLNAAGFSNSEIASLLNTTANNVGTILHGARRGRKQKSPAKKAGATRRKAPVKKTAAAKRKSVAKRRTARPRR
jgi:hypothetical protein